METVVKYMTVKGMFSSPPPPCGGGGDGLDVEGGKLGDIDVMSNLWLGILPLT